MRIAVNTRFLLKDRLEGIGWFTYETFKRIVNNHPEHEFFFFFDRPFMKDFVFGPNVKPVVVPPPARQYYLWYCWFELAIPYMLKKHKADLFVSTDGYLSLSTLVPSTLVIHDLAFEHYPHDINKMSLKWYKKYTPQYVQMARRIATVSEFSKKDIIEKYDVPAGKIDVVYNGSNTLFRPVNQRLKEQTRKIYSGGRNYFIFVGAIHPRKNVARLFQAFDRFKENDYSGIKLLIVGRKGWHVEETYEVLDKMKYKDDVVFTGRVSTTELINLIGSALALTYVPYFEGFGIPIIEAQAAGTPVITSNITSMPEAAGEGAIKVNPFSVEEIAAAMTKLAADKPLREQLVIKGMENSKHYSWDSTANKLWDTMMKSL